MEVIKCGIAAKPKLSNIDGMVTAISIRFDRVTYEVTYFYNGEYKTAWFVEEEIEVVPVERQSIGFK